MRKLFFLLFLPLSLSFGQSLVNGMLYDNWDFLKKDFLWKTKNLKYEEKDAMGFKGYLITDTLNYIVIEKLYMFNSGGIQKARGIMNKNKTKIDSEKLFNYLLQYMNKSLGKCFSNNDILGIRGISWKTDRFQVLLNFGSDNCMLTILKQK